MYRNNGGFFDLGTQSKTSSTQWGSSRNLVKTAPEICTLYRGINDLNSFIFDLPTVLTGLFGLVFPEVITMRDIELHKLTSSKDHHLVAMTENVSVARNWGSGSYIEIDLTLIQQFSIDVHASYRHNQLNFPGRMEHEAEHCVLAVPYCCIKKIVIKDLEFSNPFYLSISQQNKAAIEEFGVIYCQFLSLLRKKYAGDFQVGEEQEALRDYIKAYEQFYREYNGAANPFDHTLSELETMYPEFMAKLNERNPQYSNSTVLKHIAFDSAENALKKHPYTSSIEDFKSYDRKPAVTCYDDVYAIPVYD